MAFAWSDNAHYHVFVILIVDTKRRYFGHIERDQAGHNAQSIFSIFFEQLTHHAVAFLLNGRQGNFLPFVLGTNGLHSTSIKMGDCWIQSSP